jgi:hypothetical protein
MNAKATKKTQKRPVRKAVKNFNLPVEGATLRSLTKAFEASGGKGNISKFAARCLKQGIAGIS